MLMSFADTRLRSARRLPTSTVSLLVPLLVMSATANEASFHKMESLRQW